MGVSAEIRSILDALEDCKYKVWGLQSGVAADCVFDARLVDALDSLEGAEQALLDVLALNRT